VRPASARPNHAYMMLLVATEMRGRFHRIRSSAAARCASAPQVARFSHGLGPSRKSSTPFTVTYEAATLPSGRAKLLSSG
jgi:hypothetical protein